MADRPPRSGRKAGDDESPKAVLVETRSASFSGPLPPPSVLAQYSEIIPNGAERIMGMAERQSAHREQLEAAVIKGNVANQTRGSYFAFIICLVAIIGGFILIEQGKNVSGLVSILSALGSLAGLFIYTKQQQSKERQQKAVALSQRRARQ